jgi:plastocyanin
LKASALTLAGLASPIPVCAAKTGNVVEIRMWSGKDGSTVGFDPVGIFIEPGQTVRWVNLREVHTTTAYHPQNGGRSLRIPMEAVAWNSGYLVNPRDHFEVRLTVEGVYDYFCIPHEMAGMVGRIVVGRPAGPGTLPIDYFLSDPKTAHWLPVPPAAAIAFPDIEEIMTKKIVRLPGIK